MHMPAHRTQRLINQEPDTLESLLFILNSAAVVVLVYMGFRDERRKSGALPTSYFRYGEDKKQTSNKPSGPAGSVRGRLR